MFWKLNSMPFLASIVGLFAAQTLSAEPVISAGITFEEFQAAVLSTHGDPGLGCAEVDESAHKIDPSTLKENLKHLSRP